MAALVAGCDYPRTYREFVKMFPDNAACAAYLEKLRWPAGFWRSSRSGSTDAHPRVVDCCSVAFLNNLLSQGHLLKLKSPKVMIGQPNKKGGANRLPR